MNIALLIRRYTDGSVKGIADRNMHARDRARTSRRVFGLVNYLVPCFGAITDGRGRARSTDLLRDLEPRPVPQSHTLMALLHRV